MRIKETEIKIKKMLVYKYTYQYNIYIIKKLALASFLKKLGIAKHLNKIGDKYFTITINVVFAFSDIN